jgi:hypothetical protein
VPVPRRDHGFVATRAFQSRLWPAKTAVELGGVAPPFAGPCQFCRRHARHFAARASCWGCGRSRRPDQVFRPTFQANFPGQLFGPIFRANFSGQFFRPTFWEPARIVKQQVPSLAAAPSPAHRAGPPCQAALAPPIPAARALPPGGSAVGERAQIAFTRPETPSRSSMLGRYARARRRRPGMGYQRERIAAVADAPMPFLARSPWALSAAKNNQKNRVPSAADVGSELTRPTPAWRVRRVYQRPRQP